MFRGIVRWMRRVLPSNELVAIAIVIDLAMEIAYVWMRWNFFGFFDETMFSRARFGWTMFCAVIYGVHRVVNMHPITNPDYRGWLELTPWTADKPLPGGPLQLVPQDLIVVCLMMLLCRVPSLQTLYIPIAFLAAYQLGLEATSWTLGHWRLAYLIGFALGFVLFFIEQPMAAFVAAGGSYVISRIAISRALRTFPWTLSRYAEMGSLKAIFSDEKRRRLGWPYDQLSPRQPQRVIAIHDGVNLSGLLSWWWFAAQWNMDEEARKAMDFFVAFVTIIGVSLRVNDYVKSHRSPIGILGRICTFRWIIPSYDKIFVAPALALVVLTGSQLAAVAIHEPRQFGGVIQPWIGVAVSSAGLYATLLLLLVAGPTLEHWRLAAKHRITFDMPFGGQSGQFERI